MSLESMPLLLYTTLMDQRKYLVFNPAVQKFVESYSYCFNVKVTFFSLEIEELLVGLHSLDDDYCTLIQDKLHLRYRCLQQDRMICQQSKDDGQRLVYTCHGGLTEAVIPIEIAGSLVCYALIGQFRTSETLEPSIVRSWLQSGFELAILEEAFLKRPLYDTPMLEKMFELFKVSIGLLIETESLRVRQPDLIEKVLMYLDTNIGESITLADVSKAVHRSPSSITHTLQAKLGCSFQQLLINKRLATFEHAILRDPGLQIQEAARRAGYQDPLYFSRLYKKNRGQTPSEFQAFAEVSAKEQHVRYLSSPIS